MRDTYISERFDVPIIQVIPVQKKHPVNQHGYEQLEGIEFKEFDQDTHIKNYPKPPA